MKLTTAFLVLCVVLLSNSADASFSHKSVDSTKTALTVKPVTRVMANSILKNFKPLKFILVSLGIPVGQLVESSQKCVAELGPEAMGAMKTLLGALTYFG
ncbi:secretoglobin family 3A member 1 [Talpa occidentalis]|uniref:secretoglobin family 3A member 1 n=1 Tax=Talpa occidentalis TaxID=50954 RepID=UPI00188E42D9|nr:secretoglobin family 3A member 1 [Talpa occidentalis]